MVQDEKIEAVARAIMAELYRQESGEPVDPASIAFDEPGLEVSYIDQQLVDMASVARAAIAAYLADDTAAAKGGANGSTRPPGT